MNPSDIQRTRTGRSLVRSFLIVFFEPEIRAWHGKAPLWKVFWGYGVLASTLLTSVYAVASYENRVAAQQVLLVFFAVYTLWILVSVWRCSGNCQEPHWGMLARLLTVVWAGNTVMVLAFLQLGLVKTYLGL
jgi:hypothetical protein